MNEKIHTKFTLGGEKVPSWLTTGLCQACGKEFDQDRHDPYSPYSHGYYGSMPVDDVKTAMAVLHRESPKKLLKIEKANAVKTIEVTK